MSTPSETTRLRLIEAAIRLFGDHGIEAVSLRAAAQAAGARNTAAVHYHFKDREGLLQACLAHIAAALRTPTSPVIAPTGDALVDLLAEAFAPLMTLDVLEPAWGGAAQTLLMRVLMGEGKDLSAHFQTLTEDDVVSLEKEIQPITQERDAARLRAKIDLAALLIISAVAYRSDMRSMPSTEEQMADLLRFCAAGLRA